ncbi:MAG: 1-deoxy-D-xylulose-5-phosphate synthase [Rikenellaceae bacterium]|jgi:1-deoxy-D-xylulose-5-phosphate synthase|nr:1-deoxy-D-xylulose-5-phosphate synthase [Rikenellaceae bacterium]
MSENKTTYLDQIDTPDDLRRLKPEELPLYSGEVREFIVRQLSSNPGHLGSSLGTVELTVALHYVFNTPHDKIVWDVGHQSYAHKILTGRRDQFATKRTLGGLSGFPVMAESIYDSFGAGHASTSISAALGMAAADDLTGEKRQVVAIIGDGSLSGGLAYEGLNNAGAMNTDLLVILNDNRMSIDKNVGAMQEYLLSITASRRYNRLKNWVWDHLGRFKWLRRQIQKTGNALKTGLLQQSNLFEALNFRYFGPVDGHNLKSLVRVLNDLKQIPGPKLLHIVTEKGHGYQPAVENPALWHAPGRFNPENGELEVDPCDTTPPMRYQDVFGYTLIELAQVNPRIVGVTPAMPSGCSLSLMMEVMPERTFDVGIAEGHAVTFSAGMAAGGLHPFCNIYSTFMQRAYDNVIHDVALQHLDVTFCLDRAGIVGEDGATHQGIFDIAAFRAIPHVTIAAPMNEVELRHLMYTSQLPGNGAFVIRYPRGRGVIRDWQQPMEAIPVGTGRLLREGTDIALLSLGPVGNFAAQAIEQAEADGISVEHIDLRFAKPLDEALLHRVGRKFRRVITVEDGVISGGVGSAVLEFMNAHGYPCEVTLLGVPDEFPEHGTPHQLHHRYGFDTEGILNAIRQLS